MTAFTTKQIDELASILAGDKLSRSPTKDKAIARLVLLASQNGIETRRDMPGIYAIIENSHSFEAAKEEISGYAADDDELQDPDAEAAAYADGKGYSAPPRGPSPATLGVQAAKDDDAERLHEISQKALDITQADMDGAERVAIGHWKITKGGVTIEITKRKGLNEYVAKIGEHTGDRKNYYAAIRAAVAAFNGQGA